MMIISPKILKKGKETRKKIPLSSVEGRGIAGFSSKCSRLPLRAVQEVRGLLGSLGLFHGESLVADRQSPCPRVFRVGGHRISH